MPLKYQKEYWVIASRDFPLTFESESLSGTMTDKIEYAHLFATETLAHTERNKFDYPEKYEVRKVVVEYEF